MDMQVVFTQLVANDDVEVVSSSGSDTTQVVTVDGRDAGGAFVTATATLNGTTPVAVPGGTYTRVLRTQVAFAGSYGKVQNGPVRLRTVSGSVDIAVMPVDRDSNDAAIWTLNEQMFPAGITGWHIEISDVQQVATIEAVIQARNVTQDRAWITLDQAPALDDDFRTFSAPLIPITNNIKTDVHDIRIRFNSSKASIHIHAGFSFVQNELGLTKVLDIFT